MSESENKYWAFLSYSHKDEKWAVWLHHALETYSIPRKLVGRKVGSHTIPSRLVPIFRDRDELSVDADLSGRIKLALSQARFLIVICSPNAVRSKNVNEEISVFKQLGRERQVLCLIVDGKPHASEEADECFAESLLYRIDSHGNRAPETIEPIAADARKGKDGKTNAKLKLISGVLGIGFDELKERDRRRRKQQTLFRLAAICLLIVLTTLIYVASADAGLKVPLSARIRTLLDRHESSVFRKAHSDSEVREAAARQRQALYDVIAAARAPDGLIFDSLKVRKDANVWVTSQCLTAVFHSRDLPPSQVNAFVAQLDLPFRRDLFIEMNGVKLGWLQPTGEPNPAMPALWTAAALAVALGQPGILTGEDRARAEQHFLDVQEVLRAYNTGDGGWNMFANQLDPYQHNAYPTALGLLVLLEAREAQLPWGGSSARRDELLKMTAQWLVDRYDDKASPPGWHDASESTHEVFDGLTLQIFSELLRAEAETGFQLPPKILRRIPEHLEECASRDMTFPFLSAAYTTPARDYSGRQYTARASIGFLWRSWAIDGAVRWLRRADKYGAPKEERVRVQRVLGHLVVDLGDDATKRASSEFVFIAAETLYGLASVPPATNR